MIIFYKFKHFYLLTSIKKENETIGHKTKSTIFITLCMHLYYKPLLDLPKNLEKKIPTAKNN